MKWIGKHIFGFDATFRQDVTIDGNLTVAGTSTSFGDGDKIILGDGSDAEIYVSGDDLYIVNTTDDKDIILQSDDGSGGTTAYITLDGSVAKTIFDLPTRHIDNKSSEFGTGGDMIVYHSGSHGYVENYTGNLQFINNTDDGDIILKSDDGSGGTTAYLTLDGSATTLVASVPLTVGVDDTG